ncbi:MAG: hypothetical protein ABWX92_04535 [Mycetocola sp.]
MKIAPLKVSDPWYGRLKNNGQVEAETLRGVPIESTVEMELVELLHGGPESNYRPYLHLRGELTEAKPIVELPYGVTELAMRSGGGLNVDAFYDFNPRQLSDLVSKGYFTEQFQVPNEMSGIPWTLPGKADFLIVAPELSDQPPVVFMNVHDQSQLELNETNSGYELSSYFPDYSPEAEQQAANAPVVDGPELGGSGLDMFSDVDFSTYQPDDVFAPNPAAAVSEERAQVPSSVFSRLVSEIEARRYVEPEISEAPESDAIVPGSLADVYHSRVSPAVEQVLSSEQIEAEIAADAAGLDIAFEQTEDETEQQAESAPELAVTADGFLDLSAPEPELAPLPMGFDEDTSESHREAAAARTARIRTELAEDEDHAVGDESQPNL